ncbi:MAG: hypothetical protein NXI32_01530 [bacterium]|nr:hypothetical protein [bacterium]
MAIRLRVHFYPQYSSLVTVMYPPRDRLVWTASKPFYPIVFSIALWMTSTPLPADDKVTYQQHVAPILNKHCAGCHNADDREGDFSLGSFEDLRSGTPEGPVVVDGKPEESKLVRLMTGVDEPRMPPEDEPAVAEEDIETIRKWIALGMPSGDSESMVSLPRIPKLTPAAPRHHYVGAAEVVGDLLVLGKLGRLEAYDLAKQELRWTTEGLAGKVNSLRVNDDQTRLVVGSGIAGLKGEISIVDTTDGSILSKLQGHNDTVYCASLSPDGKWLASGSYDRSVLLWDMASRQLVREFQGHNGAIYDLDFDPSSSVLATASGDQTIKLWNVLSGDRLDTLGQPEGEMLCVRFSQDGDFIFAAGTDRQIRKWQLVSREKPAINPMLVARFAHESEILLLRKLGRDRLLSASSDLTTKLWDTNRLEPLGEILQLAETPVAIGVATPGSPHDDLVATVVEIYGEARSITRSQLPADSQPEPIPERQTGELASQADRVAPGNQNGAESISIAEVEPNDQLNQALLVRLPAQLSGTLEPAQLQQAEDQDLYRFAANKGERWIIDVNTPDDSSLDSLIDILDRDGQPVVRTRMQAVRESYFTFRGKDSDTSDDFRLHKWEDMELDEYLYASGEITKLWLYPRGPDSGFKVYPGFGNRYTYFGTTPVAHALGEPAYIVRELREGEVPLPNGLPIFPIYFENDDDPLRRAGRDSRLSFTAPEAGEYFLRVRDARGFSGPNFKYEIQIRSPQPDFELEIQGESMSMPVGSGREWQVQATRLDGLDSPIEIHIEGLPAGFLATNPVIIEQGQDVALGTIFATAEAVLPDDKPSDHPASAQDPATDQKEDPADTESPAKDKPVLHLQLIARCEVEGKTIERRLDKNLNVQLSTQQEVQVRLFDQQGGSQEIESLTIRPGQTISALVRVERNGSESSISFGKEDSGRNLPHGAFVDNIGLNGLLITEGNNQREFFITAAPKLKPGRRQFHVRSETEGKPTSRPTWLEVVSGSPPNDARASND